MKSTAPMSVLLEIGERLRECRIQMRLTQNQAAEILEISKNYYGQIERGQKQLTIEKILLCHKRFKIDPTYLLTGIRPLETNISHYLEDCPREKRFQLEQLIKYACELYK